MLSFLMLLLLSAMTCLPVFVEPIMVITLGILLLVMVVATFSGAPVKMLTTPAGKLISCKISPIK